MPVVRDLNPKRIDLAKNIQLEPVVVQFDAKGKLFLI